MTIEKDKEKGILRGTTIGAIILMIRKFGRGTERE